MDAVNVITRSIKRSEVGELGKHLQSQAKCPKCGIWGDVDGDQLCGSVSLICPECGWHGWIEEGR
jgi:hypothetical protein